MKEKEEKARALVKIAYLHKAIMIDGKTEATIKKDKIPGLKFMEWTPNGFLLIKTDKSTHVLPGAAVSDSILEG